MAVLCMGRNGYFWLKRVSVCDGVGDADVIVAFSSKLKAKNPPMAIEGSAEEVRSLLQSVLDELGED